MKASRLFSLVAMAALAVGCTQEEFAPVGENAAVDLSNRPSLGDVVLNMQPQTRLVIEDGSSLKAAWTENDQLGANIIDAPDMANSVNGKDLSSEGGLDFSSLSWTYADYANGVKKEASDGKYYSAQEAGIDASEFYDVVEYVSSNYPYIYKSGAFTTQANLVEGNYMFYAPYNPQLLLRERVNVVLPMIQDCSDDVMIDTNYKGEASKVENGGGVSSTALEQFYAGTMAGFEKAPVLVGYKFLEAPKDGSVIYPEVVMNYLYAYPMITIKNDFNGYFYGETNESTSATKATAEMTIDSIQIYHDDASSNLFYTAAINSDKIAEKLAKDGEWDGKRFTEGSNTTDLLDENAKTEIYPAHASIYKSSLQEALLEEVNTDLAYKENHVTCVLGKTLKYGESYHFHAILPAANYEKTLKARVFVKIDGTRYVIAPATNTVIGSGNDKYESSDRKDFVFEDALNGGEDCVLIRGQHYPKAEFQEDGVGTKGFAGTMMTLNLADGTAFELKTVETPTATNSGFEDNEDFIEYLKGNVQRGVALNEVPALNNIARDGWKSYSTGVAASAGNFAFATDTKCIIDAQLIKDLVQQTVSGAVGEPVKLTLTATNLPIADDVKYTVGSTSGEYTTYTFTTFDEDPVEYKINFKTTSGVEFGNNGEELVSGINNIGDPAEATDALNVELKVKSGAQNAVVYLQGSSSYNTTATLKDCTGISVIYVNTNTVLNVETNCTALIVANGGIINIKSGSLSNKNNVFEGTTVVNSNVSLPAISGTVADGVKVAVEFSSVWPENKIPAATQINTVTINRNAAGTQTIEQAQMDIFAELTKGVDLTLGANITGITSASDVTLTNLKSLNKSATSNVTWTSGTNVGVTVHKVEIGGTKTTIASGIVEGTNVTFE